MAAASLRQPVDMSLDELRIELIHPELTRLRNFLASAPAHAGVPRADVLPLVQIAEALSLASDVMPARFS